MSTARIALVTGSTSGIGLGVAERLAAAGCRVERVIARHGGLDFLVNNAGIPMHAAHPGPRVIARARPGRQ